MNLTNDILCCPYPSIDRSNALLTSMRNKTCDSFAYLSAKVLEKIDLNYDTLISDINKYRYSDSPLSIISTFHTLLNSLVKSGDHKAIIALFYDFKALNVKRKAFSLISHNTPNQILLLREQKIISDVGKNSFDGTYNRKFTFDRPTVDSMSIFEVALYKSLEAVYSLDNILFKELSAILDYIWVVQTNNMNAGVSFQTYGIVYIREMHEGEHWTRILEHLVHEAAHLYLYAVMTIDPIFDKNQSNEQYSSPFRIADRPIGGIYHAMFVLARTIYIFSLFKKHSLYQKHFEHIKTSYNEQENDDDFIVKFNLAYRIIKENAHLTTIGALLLNNCADLVHSVSSN